MLSFTLLNIPFRPIKPPYKRTDIFPGKKLYVRNVERSLPLFTYPLLRIKTKVAER